MDEDELLFRCVPLLERQANCAFGNYRRFSVSTFLKNLVARLELRRAIFLLSLELWRTHTSTALAAFKPCEESSVGDMDTDNHGIECIAGDPCPMVLGAFKKFRQMRLQTETSGIFSIDAVIAFLQHQKVVMDIGKVIKQISQAFVLWMVAYLVFIGSHRISIS